MRSRAAAMIRRRRSAFASSLRPNPTTIATSTPYPLTPQTGTQSYRRANLWATGGGTKPVLPFESGGRASPVGGRPQRPGALLRLQDRPNPMTPPMFGQATNFNREGNGEFVCRRHALLLFIH